jgi:AraC family transcriptional regulator of arabinose operon
LTLNDDAISSQIAANLLEHIILLCANNDHSGDVARSYDPRVLTACRFIDDNLHTSVTTNDIAVAAGLSPSHLSYLFSQASGLSLQQWRQEQALQFARRLLMISSSPIKNIAAHTGFEDPLYFSRRFHRRFGMSPKRFRRACEGSLGTPREDIHG